MIWVLGRVCIDKFIRKMGKKEDRNEIRFQVVREQLCGAGFIFRLMRHFAPCRLIAPRWIVGDGIASVLPIEPDVVLIPDGDEPVYSIHHVPQFLSLSLLEMKAEFRSDDYFIVWDTSSDGMYARVAIKVLPGISPECTVLLDVDSEIEIEIPDGWYRKSRSDEPNCIVPFGDGVRMNGIEIRNFFEGQNTIGCGDAFDVGFMLGKASGLDDQESLELGVLFANVEATLDWAEDFNPRVAAGIIKGKIGYLPDVFVKVMEAIHERILE